MKNLRVTVNGTAYDVQVEELGASSAPAAAAAPRAAAPAPAAAPAAAPKAAAPAAGAEVVSAPMPGTILSVNVKPGDKVKAGSVMFILEAMKMENEIMAPCDGQVGFVISKGSSVNTGDTLCEIK